MTNPAGQAAAQVGRNLPGPPPLVLGYVSLLHSVKASARTALAYSNIRRVWWAAGLPRLALPVLAVQRRSCLQPSTFASLGAASGHLNRAGQPGSVLAPRAARLLWLVFAAGIVVVAASVPIAVLAFAGPGPSTLAAIKAWWLIVLGVPFLSYVLPALTQSCRGRGAATWKAVTIRDTGRTAVLMSMLGDLARLSAAEVSAFRWIG